MNKTFFPALALTLALWAGPALAHAFLKSATPAVGSTSATPPTEVVITFTESIEPLFSHIVVQDATGARVDTGAVYPKGGDDTRLGVALKQLPPGTYKVIWHATSTDTHKTQGSFSFSVGTS